MKTKTMKTKTKKYYYSFLFKKEDYKDISSILENEFSKYFTGMALLCSEEQAQEITQYIKRTFTCKATRKRY